MTNLPQIKSAPQAKKIIIKIAGLAVSFDIKNAAMFKAIKKRYSGYMAVRAKPILILKCVFTKIIQVKSDKVHMVLRGTAYEASRQDFRCKWNGLIGDVRMLASVYAFDACLRVLYSTLLPYHGGVLLHASSIKRRKIAYVFPGPSGSGKTTISHLSKMPVLNDEITAVKLDDKRGVRVWGTPFWGEMGTGPVFKSNYKLFSFYFLNKSKENNKELLPAIIAAPRLLKCCCNFDESPDKAKCLLDVAIELLQRVPCYELYFTRSRNFLKVI